jgi:hypothetical protein
LDVLALQYLYGKNLTYNTGNTAYSLTETNYYLTLWDAGGTDTLDASTSAKGWTIFLPNDALSTLVDTKVGLATTTDDYLSSVPQTLFWLTGDYENVVGSGYADIIYGNLFDNSISGGAGNDTMYGGAGNDTFIFAASGNGVDTISDLQVGDIISISGCTFASPVTTGNGSSLGLNQIQCAVSNGNTNLYIGTNSTPGFDLQILLNGIFSPTQFLVSGSNITLGAFQNTDPTGSVTIAGTPTQGQILTASNTLADVDGLGSISYQWQADGINIDGATSSTLTLGVAQLGKVITVVAGYTDELGTSETKTSSGTSSVIPLSNPITITVSDLIDNPEFFSNLGQYKLNIVDSYANVIASISTLIDAMQSEYINSITLSGSASQSINYSSIDFGPHTTLDPYLELISLITNRANFDISIVNVPIIQESSGVVESSAYYLALLDSSINITIARDWTDLSGTAVNAGIFVNNLSFSPSTSVARNLPWISYEVYSKEVLSRILAFDGTTPVVTVVTDIDTVSNAYSMLRTDTSLYGVRVAGSDIGYTTYSWYTNSYVKWLNLYTDVIDVPIANASTVLADSLIHQIAIKDTTSNITANLSWLQSNLGEITSISIADTSVSPAALQMTYAQQDTYSAVLAKIAGSYSIDFINNLPTGSVTIAGTPTQGQTLTASNTLDDEDGLGSITYQWQADGIDIASATSNTFKLGAAQVGKAITVVASYTDLLGAPETKISSASSRVVADASLPTLASSVPADNASSVYPTSNLVLSFSEAVGAGSGNIVLTNLANGSDTRTIAVTDASQVSFSGTDLSINPSANLLPGASYAISMASGVVVDYANNPYAGISGNTALDFTVASTVNLSGHVYAWKSHTLIDGVSVTPSTGSATSSSGGLFNLSNLVVGDYTFAASRTATSDSTGSAITSADALAALKIAVGINPNSDPDGAGSRVAATLSPYQLMAADVTGDGRVTSADALAILKMAVNLSTAVTPTWIFADESQIFNLSSSNVNYSTAISKTLGADQTLNLVAVLKGDVNGSWGTSAAATTHVDYSNPTYFATLANSLQVTQDVWGIS